MSAPVAGRDATFAGMAPRHCLKCHYSFADRPAYDAHRGDRTATHHPGLRREGDPRPSRLGLEGVVYPLDRSAGRSLPLGSSWRTPPDPPGRIV